MWLRAPSLPGRRLCASALAFLLGAACVGGVACGGTPDREAPLQAPRTIDASLWHRDAAWLADEARGGRGLGSPGLEEAAAYLAQAFADTELEPAGDDGGWLQSFEAPVATRVVETRLVLAGHALEPRTDFHPLFASANGETWGAPVFVGFGISDEESGWDDYAGIDVEGRIVAIVEGPPPEGAFEGSRFGFGRRSYKLLNARRHGARAVLLLPGVAEVGDVPEPHGATGEGPMGANPTRPPSEVVALELSSGAGGALAEAAGTALGALVARAEAGPASHVLETEVELLVRIERRTGVLANVVGRLAGSDPTLGHEAVVIGAHYDHLGGGSFGSLAPERRGEVHPGADDNASGAAGLVALARAFASGPAPPRSLVFIAFTAEEAGLLGSAHHVAHPAVALDDTVAMINLDMVGRLRDDTVTIFASETGEGLEALVREAAREEGLGVEIAGGGLGPSDHASFTTNGIPAVFFFTGLHPEYHTPDDRAALLEVAGSGRVLALVARVTEAIAAAPSRPKFTGDTQRAAHGSGAESSGYGPYLGTVPAFGGEPVRGVRLSGVRSGSPAEAAGLRSGDVIVVFAGTEVVSLEEFAALLFTSAPGARVGIVALRGEERIETEATLGRRR